MYRVKVERDSVTPNGKPLTSFVIRFPRIVLAEAVTHRRNSDSWTDEISCCERTTTQDISKNSASSRAIPFNKMMEVTTRNPYVPRFTANQRGMQGPYVEDEVQQKAEIIWQAALRDASAYAFAMSSLGVHKQDCNRLLEPWAWVEQIVTSSHWDNFFALRCDDAAHPAIRQVARMMYLARQRSQPVQLDYGQWHLPFVPLEAALDVRWQPSFRGEINSWLVGMPDQIRHSAARCAWVSTMNAARESTQEAMERTWKTLVESRPVHASVSEHQATPLPGYLDNTLNHLQGNLNGWIQLRKLLPFERVDRYEPTAAEISSWNIKEPLWVDE